jgi:N-methylhydantoinase B
MSSDEINPVQLQVIWSRLGDIPQEMGIHLRRTAFSQIVKYAADFSTAIFSWDGRLVAQGIFEPGFIGCMPDAMQAILDEYVPLKEWEPGDVVITNDPYIAAGHFPDIFSFEPVFLEDQLVGFCATVAHHADIGGAGPGSGPIDANNWYVEGLHIPPVKLYDGGTLNRELLDVLLQNVRVPDQVEGDIRAQRAASQVGKDRYRELVDSYSFDTLKTYVDEMIDRSAAAMRESIRDVPDGSYSFTEYLDGIDEPLPISVELTVDDDTLVVDFDGTADQLDGYAINATPTIVFANVLYSVNAILGPETPHTGGSVEPISMELPARSLVNPEPPAPLSKRHIIAHHIVTAINGALAQALPSEVPACGGHEYIQSFNFASTEGEQKILIDVFFSGAGARPDRDGYPAVAAVQNIRNTPIEAIEADYPIRITQYQLVPGTGGDGEFRGGNGTVRDHELLESAEVQAACERFKFGPYGLEGGHEGAVGRGIVNPETDDERQFRASERFFVEPGDVVRTYTPGGGGIGPPERRDPTTVRTDFENDLVTAEQIEDVYGLSTDEWSEP